MKVARAKLREIGPDDVDMEEYKVRDWSTAFDPSHRQNWCCPKPCVGNGEHSAEPHQQMQWSLTHLSAASLLSEVCACRRMLKGRMHMLGVS